MYSLPVVSYHSKSCKFYLLYCFYDVNRYSNYDYKYSDASTYAKTTDPSYLGRVFGLLETIATAIAPLGMIVYGLLLDMLPTSIVMMTIGGGLLLVVLVGVKQHMAKTSRCVGVTINKILKVKRYFILSVNKITLLYVILFQK